MTLLYDLFISQVIISSNEGWNRDLNSAADYFEFSNGDYLPSHLKRGRYDTTTVDISSALWIDVLHDNTFLQIT